MITTDAGARVHRRHASRHLAAVAIGAGLIVGGLAVSGAATAAPIHDYVPPLKPRPAPELTTAQVAELLPVSMVHERNAMLSETDRITTAQAAELLPVSMVHERDAMLPTADCRYVYVTPYQSGPGPTPVWTGDAKDHAGYGPTSVWTGDAKDHPGYGSSAPPTRAVWLS